MRRSLWLSGILVLAGCGTETSQAPLIEDPDVPGPSGPGRGTLQIDGKTTGFGEVFNLLAADFTGDGNRELAVGGRRFLMLNPDGSERFHFDGWNRPDRDHLVDVGWTYDMLAVPSKDRPADLLLSDSHGQAYLIDGSTGDVRWQRELDQGFKFAYLDVFGPAEEAVLFPHYGNAAYSARTGEKLWDSPLPLYHAYGQPLRTGRDRPTDLAAVAEIDWVIGGSNTAAASKKGNDKGWVYRISPEGELRWSYPLPKGDQPIALGCADLDGSGEDSILVYRISGLLTVLHTDGSLRWEKSFDYYGANDERTFVDEILARDVDGDGKEEVFVVFRDELFRSNGFGPSKVVALSPDGEELWTFDFEEHVRHAIIEEIGGKPVLLLAAGSHWVDRYGEVLALDLGPSAERRLIQRFQTPFQARAVAWTRNDGKDYLSIGSMDGSLRTVEFPTGTLHADRSLGHWSYTAAAIRRQGGDDWFATGDSFGDVRVTDEKGTLRWHRRLQVGKFGGVNDVHAASLREPGEDLLVVGGFSVDPTRPRGLVEVFTAEGSRVLEAAFDSAVLTVDTVDLDGDGKPEILAGLGLRFAGDDCRVAALDGTDGKVLWVREVATCFDMQIAPARHGSEAAEILVRIDPGLMPVPPFVGLLEANGEIRWLVEEVREISLWTLPTPAGALFGGATFGHMGFVSLRDRASGEILWQTHIEPDPDPLMPAGAPISGASQAGILVPDQTGDDKEDLAIVTSAKKVLLLDTATGSIVWQVQTEPLDTPYNRQHGVGPLFFAPATETTEALLLATQTDPWFAEGTVYGISLDGEIRSELPVAAGIADGAPVARSSGVSTVALASGLDAIVVGVHPVPVGEAP